MIKNKLTAQFEFTETGDLRAIYLNAGTDAKQVILEQALSQLLKHEPDNLFTRIKSIFVRQNDGRS